ncbi:MAG TPA: aldehyde ferredoxin oxidoreductase N-terminal domain-containing protein, partial [Dehalococcoidales bacterium]|nr:aldehyde ferredoxin oxidoreductase N-terminal domain-containing protein [Dehalococcoidales bacterium]
MANGYNGKLLRVDLTKRNIQVEPLDENLCRDYLGGVGFISSILLKEVPPHIDALDPGNKLIFALGPLTGLSLPGNDRFCVGGKSPMGGAFGKAEAGGWFGAELKRAGYDLVIIEGKADTPVYIWINNGQVEIRDARHLWGKTTKETQETIRQELGDERIRLAMIGPAGENLVRYAGIMSGLFDAAARSGLGAVMGSKNLKAIAARGQAAPPVNNPEEVKRLRQWFLANLDSVQGLRKFGTSGFFVPYEKVGNLPVRNFRYGLFPGANKIDSNATQQTIGYTMDGCYACPLRCKRKINKIEGPYSVDPDYGGAEYETFAALGTNCGIDDLIALFKANELCNAYSVDSISIGNAIAFAMECFEKGLLTKQ